MDIKIVDNKFSHFICKIWFDVNAIVLIPISIMLVSERLHYADQEYKDVVFDHERVHVRQAENHGRFLMTLRYIFSPKWRLEYEAEAYVVNILARIKKGLAVNTCIDMYSDILSSNTYLRMCTKEEAIAALHKHLKPYLMN
jgi:hypothetical protein